MPITTLLADISQNFLEAVTRGEVWGGLILGLALWFVRRAVRPETRWQEVLQRMIGIGSVLALAYSAIFLVGETLGLAAVARVIADKGGRLAIVLVSAYLGWEFLELLITHIGERLRQEAPPEIDRRVDTVESLVRWVGRVAILTIATAMVLDIFDINIAPLVAGAGVLGLAVSLGSQQLVQDLIAGLFLILEDQFRVGDGVQIAGIAGTVEEVTLRTTTVRDFHGNLHIIPNSQIKIVTNRTRDWSRAVAEVGVAYDSDLEKVMEVLNQVGQAVYEENQEVFLEVPTASGPETLGDSAITFRLLARVQAGQHWGIQRQMRRRIKEAFDAAGITIPFPQMDVHLDYGPLPDQPPDTSQG